MSSIRQQVAAITCSLRGSGFHCAKNYHQQDTYPMRLFRLCCPLPSFQWLRVNLLLYPLERDIQYLYETFHFIHFQDSLHFCENYAFLKVQCLAQYLEHGKTHNCMLQNGMEYVNSQRHFNLGGLCQKWDG